MTTKLKTQTLDTITAGYSSFSNTLLAEINRQRESYFQYNVRMIMRVFNIYVDIVSSSIKILSTPAFKTSEYNIALIKGFASQVNIIVETMDFLSEIEKINCQAPFHEIDFQLEKTFNAIEHIKVNCTSIIQLS